MFRTLKLLAVFVVLSLLLQACSLTLPFGAGSEKAPLTGEEEVVELPAEPVAEEEAVDSLESLKPYPIEEADSKSSPDEIQN